MGRLICTLASLLLLGAGAALAQPLPPPLTGAVNDFAGVIDPTSRERLEAISAALQRATGDVVVVATIPTYAPYSDIREYAVKMFENHGRGIGQRGMDNGVLVLLAVRDRAVWIEVGYGLEEFIPDGFAGETARRVMVPHFRRGAYGAGLVAGVTQVVARIAERRGVTLDPLLSAPAPERSGAPGGTAVPIAVTLLFLTIFAFLLLSAVLASTTAPRYWRRRYWYSGPWSGWQSGVGPFGAGRFGGGFGGFGGGSGGFGGFGGGRSGGGGGGASW